MSDRVDLRLRPRPHVRLLLTALSQDAAGSLRSPAAVCIVRRSRSVPRQAEATSRVSISGAATERCVGCGARVQVIDGPVHRYMTSAPGCWAMFGQLCARLLRDPYETPGRQLCFDAYAVQHPGSPGPQAIQSVAGHLVSLYAQLERSASAARAHVLIERATRNEAQLRWLSPPSFTESLTVAHVLAQLEEPYNPGREWATSAWRAWAPHHEQVHAWHEFLANLDQECALGVPAFAAGDRAIVRAEALASLVSTARSLIESVAADTFSQTALQAIARATRIWLYSSQNALRDYCVAPQAAVSLRALSAYDRTAVREALETHPRFEPAKVSKSRIKRLRGLVRPQFRLRVNDIRVFYDIAEEEVQVLAIVTKAEAKTWLDAFGEATP